MPSTTMSPTDAAAHAAASHVRLSPAVCRELADAHRAASRHYVAAASEAAGRGDDVLAAELTARARQNEDLAAQVLVDAGQARLSQEGANAARHAAEQTYAAAYPAPVDSAPEAQEALRRVRGEQALVRPLTDYDRRDVRTAIAAVRGW